MGEIFFVFTLIAGLIMPFILLTGWGRKFWMTIMSIIGVVVVGGEVVGKLTIGKSISQMYWDWSVLHVSTSWLVVSLLALGWLSLLIHLQWKVITRKK